MKRGEIRMNIRIAYLYPKLMNIYGDRGNIICLKKRCQSRKIAVQIKEISLNDHLRPDDFDLLFAGGGQDRQQQIIAHDLQTKKTALKEASEMNRPMLTICGSYQLFGHYFKPFRGSKLPGINILDVYTTASKQRKIGNVIVKPLISQSRQTRSQYLNILISNLVGFENHSGNTFIKRKTQNAKRKTVPLGKVIKGFGNNGQDKTEGAIYKNVIGTYLHGPILPKNPHLADWLIKTALEVKYQTKIKLKPLDDSLEWQAHQAAIKRTHKTHWLW